jgi:outer membrane protein TolC
MSKQIITVILVVNILLTSGLTAQISADSFHLQSLALAAINQSKSLKNSALEIEKSTQIKKGIHHVYIPTLEAKGSYAYSSGSFNLNTQSLPITIPGITLPAIIPGLPAIEIPSTSTAIPPIDQTIDFDGNIWMGGLTAKWTLFTGLKAPFLSKAMTHKIEAQRQILKQDEADLISEVAMYYDKIALLSQTKILLDQQINRLQQETLTAKKAYEQGLITHHEYQKVELAQLELASKQLEYEGSKELLIIKLHQLTGIEKEELYHLKVSLYPRETGESQQTYLERPELIALEEVSQATKYKYKSEFSGYLPQIQAFASHQYMGMTNGNMGDLGINELSAYPLNMVGVGVKWELFDGLHTHNERQKAQIEMEQTINRKEEVQELLELNYTNWLTQYHNLNAQTKLKKRQMEVSKQSTEISYKEYQNGLIQLSDYLESQASYTTVTLDYYDTLCHQRNSALELLKATGNLQINKL